MRNKKENLIISIALWIFLLFLILFSMRVITYQREVTIITINDNLIQDIKFGFQRITLMQGLFNPIPKGDLRLNYEVEDKGLVEISYIGNYENIGEGTIILTNFKFPINDSWEIRVELKDKNLSIIDKKCSLIKFKMINGGKKISQENCNY